MAPQAVVKLTKEPSVFTLTQSKLGAFQQTGTILGGSAKIEGNFGSCKIETATLPAGTTNYLYMNMIK
jgi:hypothetical protein